MKGIYKYTDLKTGEIVYIGKDSHIDINNRHNQHLAPSGYDDQPFNRILQNNPERYEYSIIWVTKDCSTLKLNKMEILFGKIFDPKFNFGKFGSGGCINHTKETKQKISENNARYWEGKTLSDEHRQKISKSNKGKHKYWEGKTRSEESKINISKSKNTVGYFRVSKWKCKSCTQGFLWIYRYSEDGKDKKISSIDIEKLEQKVKSKGLVWKKLK